MRTKRKRKGLRPRLIDQEILEQCVRNFTHSAFTLKQFDSIQEGRLDLWKRTLLGIFLAGPFVMLIPFICWFGRISLWDLGVLIGINAAFLILISSLYHFISVKIKVSHLWGQEQLEHFLSAWFFSILSWLSFWCSLMVLLGSIGCFTGIPGALWWIPALMYIAGGIGLWLGRKEILRAIIEGPEAHPWFRPIQLLFSVSVGFCIFTAAVFRILGNLLEHIHADLPFLFLTALSLAVSIMFLGLAMVGGIIGYLHYQRLRGSGKLKV